MLGCDGVYCSSTSASPSLSPPRQRTRYPSIAGVSFVSAPNDRGIESLRRTIQLTAAKGTLAEVGDTGIHSITASQLQP